MRKPFVEHEETAIYQARSKGQPMLYWFRMQPGGRNEEDSDFDVRALPGYEDKGFDVDLECIQNYHRAFLKLALINGTL